MFEMHCGIVEPTVSGVSCYHSYSNMADTMLLRALQANAKSVNLSCKKLKKVPKLIGKIQSVLQIDLKGNGLQFLPDELGNLMQVSKLLIPSRSVK